MSKDAAKAILDGALIIGRGLDPDACARLWANAYALFGAHLDAEGKAACARMDARLDEFKRRPPTLAEARELAHVVQAMRRCVPPIRLETDSMFHAGLFALGLVFGWLVIAGAMVAAAPDKAQAALDFLRPFFGTLIGSFDSKTRDGAAGGSAAGDTPNA